MIFASMAHGWLVEYSQQPRLRGTRPVSSYDGGVDELTAVPTLVNKGSIAASFDDLSRRGMPPADIPAEVWPVPAMIDEALFTAGAPVFAASIFRFADSQGLGLCICMHHDAVDATRFAEVVRLWTQSLAGSGLPLESNLAGVRDRLSRLSGALSPHLTTSPSQSTDSLFASHPEYSRTPPMLPSEFPSCTSKLFSLRTARVNRLKELLSSSMPTPPTTNTLVCALIWSSITRARMQRNPALADETSRLAMAINGRRRIGAELSTPGNPYLGKTVLYSLARLSAEGLRDASFGLNQPPTESLPTLCNIIAESSAQIDSRHIAEVYHLVERVDDYKTIFVGWDLFGARDLTITSWADLDLYDMEFGEGLGKPEFIGVPYAEADGVGLILPRKRGVPNSAGGSDEVLDIMVMLRREDMDALDSDFMWESFMS